MYSFICWTRPLGSALACCLHTIKTCLRMCVEGRLWSLTHGAVCKHLWKSTKTSKAKTNRRSCRPIVPDVQFSRVFSAERSHCEWRPGVSLLSFLLTVLSMFIMHALNINIQCVTEAHSNLWMNLLKRNNLSTQQHSAILSTRFTKYANELRGYWLAI